MTTGTVNSLSKAASAYLRSAMHQPIQWHEWGEDAFAAAQRENKPVLLDIGAVWCHWCHVMDRESYESPEVAQIVNERFIAVKVDRDERPDIDSRYQIAVQALSGQGGWPLTAFLTPEGKPFYGGTYFPPDDHYGRPSFKRVLLTISDAYHEKNGDVLEQAKMVENAMAHAESHAGQKGEFSAGVIDAILEGAVKSFDIRNGGFGAAPKFPHPSTIDLLIDGYVRTGSDTLRTVFVTTLEKMVRGGVYDQLAGGFHRYSVDEHWTVPHFEKMSYDNSELLKNYVHAYQATDSEFFAHIAKDIIRWMDEWLSDREHGGFYASQDADYSMEDDGDYFTWSLDETKNVLHQEELDVAVLRYGIQEIGDMHHDPAKNVLQMEVPTKKIAEKLNLSEHQAQALLRTGKEKMYSARLQRPTPFVDKTLYTNWNALCISAYLQASQALDLSEVRHFALRSLDRILAEAWQPEQGLRHVVAYAFPSAEQKYPAGVLDDYAFTVIACLDAYEATADLSYFNFALRIADTMVQRFYDSVDGGFWDTENLPGRPLGALGTGRKPFQDSPTPAGNPAAVIALLRLHAYTNEPGYREKAEATLAILAATAGQYGMFAATYGIAAVYFSQPHTQIVIAEGDDHAKAAALYRAAAAPFFFGKSVLKLERGEIVPQELPPALAETIPAIPAIHERKTAAIVCANFSCQPPVFEAEQLRTICREISQTK